MPTCPEAKTTLGGHTPTVLDHMMRRKDVWIARRGDIARHRVAPTPTLATG